jgi:hypothetical protein
MTIGLQTASPSTTVHISLSSNAAMTSESPTSAPAVTASTVTATATMTATATATATATSTDAVVGAEETMAPSSPETEAQEKDRENMLRTGQALRDEGNKLFKEGDYRKALTKYTKVRIDA